MSGARQCKIPNDCTTCTKDDYKLWSRSMFEVRQVINLVHENGREPRDSRSAMKAAK